ncbi:hypothetical protein [Burkholderia sp. BCC1988]|uniref:hypothetical protein n=1 Tax=Burkholderia sp. BCC1988 TaxID=2817443 RepID=UPI002AB160AE|nr:hypothetical protein [Burkholderia sp. BCC1988]
MHPFSNAHAIAERAAQVRTIRTAPVRDRMRMVRRTPAARASRRRHRFVLAAGRRAVVPRRAVVARSSCGRCAAAGTQLA